MSDWTWFEIILVGLLAALLGGVMALFTSCSSIPQDYHRGALSDQIMRPLTGHKGLVNSQCLHDPKTGACTWDYTEYDLNDAPTRLRLRDAGFICEISGRAYRIALDQPGLIFETYDQSCLFGIKGFICGAKTERVIDYIPISSYQKLIDLKTECLSEFTFKYYEGN